MAVDSVLMLAAGNMTRTVLRPRSSHEPPLLTLGMAFRSQANDDGKQKCAQQSAQDTFSMRLVNLHKSAHPELLELGLDRVATSEFGCRRIIQLESVKRADYCDISKQFT